MAAFNKNSLTQVSGFNNPILAGELVWDQKTFWNLTFTNQTTGAAINLTGTTIDAQIVRRLLTNVHDSRTGLAFDIANYTPTPAAIPLTINITDATAGKCTLVIDDTTWALINSDPNLSINAVDPVGFSGRVKVTFPASGATPEDDSILFLLFIVRSDGVVVI